MRPIRLSMSGMYSYQERVDIDFEELCAHNLFGIFGPVGSGKSTILEAISYALYGQTERMTRSDRRNYNMMNLKSMELWIDFEFVAGPENKRYRFEVFGKRNTKRFEDVKKLDRSAFVWGKVDSEGKEDWIPMDSTDAGRILGLDYGNFIKTIIIPQGRFKEFLHMGGTDRTRMLKELFGLQRFELYDPAKRLQDQNKDKTSSVEGQLKELAEVPKEEMAAHEQALAELGKEAATVQERVTQLQAKNQEALQVKKLVADISETEEMLASLLPHKPEHEKRKTHLARYVAALRDFRSDLEAETTLLKKLDANSAQSLLLQGKIKDYKQQIERADADMRKLKEAYDGREQWTEKAREMDLVVQMLQLSGEAETLTQRMAKGTEKVTAQAAAIARAEAELKTANTRVQALRVVQARLPELTELHNWFRERSRLLTLLQQEEANLKTAQNARAALATEIAEMRQQPALAEAQLSAEPAELETQVATHKTELRRQLHAAENAIADLGKQDKLAEFAEMIAAGEPCPLCGATEHPAPYDAGVAGEMLATQREKKADIAAALEAFTDAALQLQQAVARLADRQAQEQQATDRRDQAQSLLTRHLEGFRWPDFAPDQPAPAAKALEAAREDVRALEKAEQALKVLEDGLKDLRHDLERFREAIAEFDRKKAGIAGNFDGLKGQLKIFDFENYRDKRPEDVAAKADRFKEQYEEITAQHDKAYATLEALKDSERKLEREFGIVENGIREGSEALAGIRAALAKQLEASAFDSLDDVRKLLAEQIDLAREQERVAQFFEDLNRELANRKAYLKQLDGRGYDAELHTTLQADLEAAEERQNALNQELGQLRERIKEMKRVREKRKILEKEHAALVARGLELGTLARLFYASGFVNYVSTIYLQELCMRANVRFRKLSRNQLQLEVDKDNAFVVRDMLNDGQTRSVKTLSGGQTFQASLSLALALADNIQQRHESSHNFFFLDGGFGTLDEDSLRIVFDTLKDLRRENRIVGVISHVEALQQEIDTYLQVEQDEETGSRVRGSWEM